MRATRYQRLMFRPVYLILPLATALFLTSCESDQPQKPHPKDHKFGWHDQNPTLVGPAPEVGPKTPAPGDENGDNGTGPIAPPPPPPPSSQEPKKPEAESSATPAPGVVRKDYPYAPPVAGKPGFVTSPYAPYSGYVDVRGFPPGTEVKDPYTQKIFLVP